MEFLVRRELFTVQSVVAAPTAEAYVGPGDIVSGAAFWGGLRAYSSATIGTNAIRLRRDSDQDEEDFITLAGGHLDVASVATWKGGANAFVVKLYDQSGNGNDAFRNTAGEQGAFTLAGLGSLPIMDFSTTSTRLVGISAIASGADNFTYSGVVNHNSTATQDNLAVIDVQLGFNPGGGNPNNAFIYGGNAPTVACSDTNWHGITVAFDLTNTDFNIDGVQSIVNPGSISGSGSPITIGNSLHGKFVELGAWPATFSGGDITSMYTNQQAYWGF